MGSSSSKTARGVARKFPARSTSQAVPPRPSKSQAPRAADLDSEAQNSHAAPDRDAIPSDFSRRLQEMGVVDPNPTFSPSSTAGLDISSIPSAPLGPMFPPARNNTTLSVLEWRRRLQGQAEEELELMRSGANRGRRFVDMRTMVEVMQLRARGYPPPEIEQRLRLQPGLLTKLGQPGLISHTSTN